MEYGTASLVVLNMKVLGLQDYKMDTAVKPMQMEVSAFIVFVGSLRNLLTTLGIYYLRFLKITTLEKLR